MNREKIALFEVSFISSYLIPLFASESHERAPQEPFELKKTLILIIKMLICQFDLFFGREDVVVCIQGVLLQ